MRVDLWYGVVKSVDFFIVENGFMKKFLFVWNEENNRRILK